MMEEAKKSSTKAMQRRPMGEQICLCCKQIVPLPERSIGD